MPNTTPKQWASNFPEHMRELAESLFDACQADVAQRDIICLFRVADEYEQPDHDLVCWWALPPSIEQIAEVMQCDRQNDAELSAAVYVWMRKGPIRHNYWNWRLQNVRAGEVLVNA